MPYKGSIQITARTQQFLEEKRNRLNQDRNEQQAVFAAIFREEKDSSGGSPLEEARMRVSFINGQIEEIEDILANATIVAEGTHTEPTIVTVGKRVVLHLRKHGAENHERIVVVIDGACDCSREGASVITPESPIGAAILGASIGEERNFESPRGDSNHIVVVSVSCD